MIWLLGVVLLLLYGVISYFRLKYRLSTATLLNDNIFVTDRIMSPFVMGLIKPRIYMPTNLNDSELDYILEHEKTHIRRYDYIVKFVAALAVVLHWFNPIIWISYFLMTKDMEMSCDESVMRTFNQDIRAQYSNVEINNHNKMTEEVLDNEEVLVKTSFSEEPSITEKKNKRVWVTSNSLLPGTNFDNMQQYLRENGQNMDNNGLCELSRNYRVANYTVKGNKKEHLATVIPDESENISFYINSQTVDCIIIELIDKETNKLLSTGVFKGNSYTSYSFEGIEFGKKYDIYISKQETLHEYEAKVSGEIIIF